MAINGNEHSAPDRGTQHHIEQLPAELFQYVLDELGARDSGMWL